MILIGENIHVISKSVQNALQQRDEEFIRNLVKLQNYMDYIDSKRCLMAILLNL